LKKDNNKHAVIAPGEEEQEEKEGVRRREN
jgi:hypothetical protein